MTTYGTLLLQGAVEVQEYKKTPEAKAFSPAWLDRLAEDMEKSSLVTDPMVMERAIDMLAHRIVDSGPMGSDFCPSFGKALDTLQRSRKRKHA